MPKTGLSNSEWRQRLHLFAQGNFHFGKGQRPRKGSDRAKVLERVENCPKHRNSVNVDPFGRRIQCHCGYHQQKVSLILNTACLYSASHIASAATIPISLLHVPLRQLPPATWCTVCPLVFLALISLLLHLAALAILPLNSQLYWYVNNITE